MLALVDVSMSRQPAKNKGLLATIPTGCPSILAKPTVMFFAQSGMISKYVLSSTTWYGHQPRQPQSTVRGGHAASRRLLENPQPATIENRGASHVDRLGLSYGSPTKSQPLVSRMLQPRYVSIAHRADYAAAHLLLPPNPAGVLGMLYQSDGFCTPSRCFVHTPSNWVEPGLQDRKIDQTRRISSATLLPARTSCPK